MSVIPVEATETVAFTPPVLAKMEPLPVFTFGTCSRRQRRALEEAMAARMSHYSQQRIRDETLVAIRKLFPADQAELNVGLLRNVWTARANYDDGFNAWLKDRDDWLAEQPEGTDPDGFPAYPPFEHENVEALNVLVDSVRAQWPPLQEMRLANLRAEREGHLLRLAFMLQSVEGLDVALERGRDGFLTEATIDGLEDAIAEATDEATALAAIIDLCNEAYIRIYLPKSAEKNSASPSPSTQTATDLPMDGQESTDGKSPASAPSEPTPES